MLPTLDQLTQKAKLEISKVSDSALNSEKYKDTLFSIIQIRAPYLDTTRVLPKIDSESIGHHNAPINVSFYVGQKMEFALFSVPIDGDMDIFNTLIPYGRWNQKEYIEDSVYYYKEHSETKITGDDDVINKINTNAKNAILGINRRLSEFKEKAESIHSELHSVISNLIEQERKHRNLKSESENKLNPFA